MSKFLRSLGFSPVRGAVYGLWLVAGGAYLTWRFGWTVEDASWPFAAFFVLAEAWLFVSTASFYALLGSPAAGTGDALPPFEPEVDVFITTVREPPALVQRTIEAAMAIRGRRTIHVCDDGRREDLRALCVRLGVAYVTRDTNAHFKAGNLNHALGVTSAPFVLVLDADHVVVPGILERLCAPFADPQVAFVQAPQVYWNDGAFAIVRSRGRSWHDGLLFHHRLQRGAARFGAACFVGTGAVLRRSALDGIGGFATESVTEDMLTSLRLHAAGWRSVYVDEPVGFLLAAETADAFAQQRRRWAEGAMQILAFENPLFRRGLSPAQRWIYFTHLTSFLGAWPTLLLYAAPAAFLLLDWNPVAYEAQAAAVILVAHVAVDVAAHRVLTAPQGRWLAAETFRLLALGVQLRATWRLFFPVGAKFRVTPKSTGSAGSWALALGPGIIGAVNLAAVVRGVLDLGADVPDASVRLAACAFAAWFVLVAATALLRLWRRPGSTTPDDGKLAAVVRESEKSLDHQRLTGSR